jgi:hypothetical protein
MAPAIYGDDNADLHTGNGYPGGVVRAGGNAASSSFEKRLAFKNARGCHESLELFSLFAKHS